MPTTKLIYGVGRIPKASEFVLGEIIVNVDDSKVFSKNKSNVVFEIGGGDNTTNNITEGDNITNISGFNTASISSSGFFTSADTSNLIISGGVGVRVTTGSNNQIIITATGEAEATIVNAETASYVEVAQTASYVDTSNLNGTLFQLSNDGDQGGILFSENDVDIYSEVSAIATGLGETDSVVFAQVSASGDIFAKRLLLPQSNQGNILEGGIIFGTEGSHGQILDDGNSLQIGYDGSDVLTVSGSDPYTKLLINGNTRIAQGSLLAEGNITASSPVPGQGNISASGLLYASASQPAAHTDSIVAVVYDTGSGQFYYTGSYGAGGGTDLSTGTGNHVPFYDSNGDIDTSAFLQFVNTVDPAINDGYREFKVGVGNDGRVNSLAGKFNHISSSIYRHNGSNIDINSFSSRIAFGNNKIDFRTFDESFDHKGPRMSLTNTELRIGSHSIDPSFGTFDGIDRVDVIVTGSISTTNYLRLGATGSGTIVSPIAGALFYSASNEFYLGFS